MRTESSAVADLIRGVQTRRLESEPGDVFVFQPPANARAPRPHYAHVPAPRSQAPAMQFAETVPTPVTALARPAPIAPLARASAPRIGMPIARQLSVPGPTRSLRAPSGTRPQHRERMWPLIVI